MFCYFLREKKEKKQKQKLKVNTNNFVRKSIDRDRFSIKKIPENIDTIIIGSGISGLTLGGLLSKMGQRILVLEQHYVAGGCMHTFIDDGIEHETGIHYIGNIDKRRKILDLITEEKVEWCKMGKNNDYVYDEIIINNKIYKFKAGEKNFINTLTEYFPNEGSNIKKYIDLVKKVSNEDLFFKLKIVDSIILKYILKYFISNDYKKYTNISAYDVISNLTDNKELIAVLCGQFGDYGISPKKVNFYIHASIVNHYLDGGYYPKGGPSEITKNIIPIIENNGGRVLVGKRVNKILINNKTAYGIEMENGVKIFAKNIVSSIGVSNTFRNLTRDYSLVEYNIFKKYYDLIDKIGYSTSFIYLFVNLKGNAKDLEIRDSNLWILPNNNLEKFIDNYLENYMDNPIPMFISSSYAKDSSKLLEENCNVTIVCMAKNEWFKQWKDQKYTKRDGTYIELKEYFAYRLLNEGLFKYYPKTKGNVLKYQVGTPLSNNFYLGVQNGEAYGLNSSNYRFTHGHALKPKTNIKNLYLTGQDICTLGFTGALMSGVLTANSMLGYGSLFNIMCGKNLINDIEKLST